MSGPRFRAVVYDHDGTLVDSLGVVVAATNAVLAAEGVAARPRGEIIAGMVLPTGRRIGSLLGVTDDRHQQSLAAAFYAAAHLHAESAAFAYGGISELLDGLAGQGVAQGVVSNNEGRLIGRILSHLHLSRHLAAVIGEEDMPAPKPDPRGLLAAVAALGVEVKDSLYVGDTVGDLETARAAGMPCIGVTWGITDRQRLLTEEFLAVVDTPAELFARIVG